MRPKQSNHLYVIYADKGVGDDRSNIYWVRSTDGGSTWSLTPHLMNSNADANGKPTDQWMPVIAIKPDGTQLFLAWNDRRADTNNNSLIDVYGRFCTLASDGSISAFGTEFRITTESFPPAFPGVLAENTAIGHYDPVWPPGGVNLHWFTPFAPWFEAMPEGIVIEGIHTTYPVYRHETGEHNGVFSDSTQVYLVWSGNSRDSQGTCFPERKQAEIRLARIPWP